MHGAPGKKNRIAYASLIRSRLAQGCDIRRVVSWLPSKFMGMSPRPSGKAFCKRSPNSLIEIGFSSNRNCIVALRNT